MSREAPPLTPDRILVSCVLLALILLALAPFTTASAIFTLHYQVQAEETTATVRKIEPGVCSKIACWVPREIAWADEGQSRVGTVRGGPSVDVRDDPDGVSLLGREFPVRYRHGDRQPVAPSEARSALGFTVFGTISFAYICWWLLDTVRAYRAARDRVFRGVLDPDADQDLDPELRVREHEIRLVATGHQRDKVAELLRTRCGLTNRDARERVHRAPTSFRIEATPVAALNTVEALRQAGAVAELRPVPTP
jgi:hypothetical protein